MTILTKFLTVGEGKPFDAKITFGHGSRFSLKNTNQSYPTITALGLLILPKTVMPKEEAHWVIVSTYNSSDARTHKVQKANGEFYFLIGDIDEGNLPMSQIADVLHRLFGEDALFRIFSTYSAELENKRWRILILMQNPLSFERFSIWQSKLIKYFESHGIRLDASANRPAQIAFTPNVKSIDSYFESNLYGNYPISVETHPQLFSQVERALLDQQTQQPIRPSLPKKKYSGENLIEQFKRDNPIQSMFKRYGYATDGQGNWRSPIQTSASYATKVFEYRWVSLSSTDQQSGLGRPTAFGCTGDAFDLFTFFEFNNNFSDARKALLEKL